MPMSFAAVALASVAMLGRWEAQTQPQPADWQRVPVQLDALSPPQRLGVRAELLRQNIPVIPQVVVVSDWGSYLRAIAHWSPAGRFPVLFDAGTAESRHDIARFVRAFEPARVVRWNAPDAVDLPRPREARQAVIDKTIRSAWDLDTIDNAPDLLELWAASPAFAPGIIAADAADPAWPAAVALAAGRAQPIVWVQTKGNPNGAFDPDEVELLASAIELGAQSTGMPWRALGDRVDALTICLNCPVKIRHGGDEFLATTDRLGRLADGTRWAWASQIFGTQEDAAYQAMCALFLMPKRALAFDGYPDEGAWRTYGMHGAVDSLRRFGLDVLAPAAAGGRGLVDWRMLGATPLACDLIMVNTKGMRNWFDLSPGRAYSGDVPLLDRPAIIAFIHSFSAIQPGLPATIAGRWFQRGAYAYSGAVHEPYLQAFVPPAILAERLTHAFPWAAAVRHDDGPVWKVAVFGDPLITLGPPAQRMDAPFSLPGAHDVEQRAQEHLASGRSADALWELIIAGADARAAELARAWWKDDPTRITTQVADAALLPAFHQGDALLLMRLFMRLRDAEAIEPWHLDVLWHGARFGAGALAQHDAETLLTVLRQQLRPEQLGADAVEAAEMMQRIGSMHDPVAFLRSVRTDRPQDQRLIDAAVRGMTGRR
ncbi:MAG: hypothetical protein KIT24_08380 [Phycisphaeraceae bacterium]|nr:hypothetical protein [Phycisphaeraceae bacterium]